MIPCEESNCCKPNSTTSLKKLQKLNKNDTLLAAKLRSNRCVCVCVCVSLGRWVESLSSQFSGLGWQLTALAAGFLHFLVALALFRKLKQKQELNLFEFTRAEFNKDREWLNQNKTSANENESSS